MEFVFGTLRSAPTENECGKMIQQCMQVWIDAIGPLATYIAPIEDGRLYPLGINIKHNSEIFAVFLRLMERKFNKLVILEKGNIVNAHIKHD